MYSELWPFGQIVLMFSFVTRILGIVAKFDFRSVSGGATAIAHRGAPTISIHIIKSWRSCCSYHYQKFWCSKNVFLITAEPRTLPVYGHPMSIGSDVTISSWWEREILSVCATYSRLWLKLSSNKRCLKKIEFSRSSF